MTVKHKETANNRRSKITQNFWNLENPRNRFVLYFLFFFIFLKHFTTHESIKKVSVSRYFLMAQDQGFEPWHRFPDLRAFQARPFNRLGNPASLCCLSSVQHIKTKSKHYFISILMKALLFLDITDIMPLYGGKINEKNIK